MHPHDIRIAAREAAYPNSQTESETVARVDGEVFDRVRLHEHQIVRAAQQFVDDQKVELLAAEDTMTRLRQSVRYAIEEGADVTPDLAKEYEFYRHRAETVLAALRRAESQAAFHSGRLNDPYGAYMALIRRYPMLNREIRL
jgi:hypothetical protein